MALEPRTPMTPPTVRANRTDDFAERLEDYIERRSCGRIHDLLVLCLDDAIVLRGRSRTHHAKQLAQEAALEWVGGHPVLTNEIVVR